MLLLLLHVARVAAVSATAAATAASVVAMHVGMVAAARLRVGTRIGARAAAAHRVYERVEARVADEGVGRAKIGVGLLLLLLESRCCRRHAHVPCVYVVARVGVEGATAAAASSVAAQVLAEAR